MKISAQHDLWHKLSNAGIAAGDFPSPAVSPWYVRAMMGFAGWFGALFFLGFIGTAFMVVMREACGAAIAAIVCCAGAWGIFRLAPRNDCFDQFGLALGLAGQGMWAAAIFQHFGEYEVAPYLFFAAIEALLALLLPNFLHRVFATLAAVTALALGLSQAGVHGLAIPLVASACALIWRNELRLAEYGDQWTAVGYGLALGVIEIAATPLLTGELRHYFLRNGEGWLQRHGGEVGAALLAAVIFLLCLDLLLRFRIPWRSRSGLTVLGVALAATSLIFLIPGLGAALLLIILGFAGGNRVLTGLGLIGLASFLFHYYYAMDQTLLVKAELLAASGGFLLVGRLLLQQLLPKQGGDDA